MPKEKLKVQVWIVSPEGQVLILKTNSERGGFWQPVTGSVEEGETLEAAALREATEETGLKFEGAPRALGFEFSFQGGKHAQGKKVVETVFWLKVAQEGIAASAPHVTLDAHEHDAYQWMAPRDAMSELKFESNAQALKLLMKKLPKPE